MYLKDVDGIAHNVDLDQTAPHRSALFITFTVYIEDRTLVVISYEIYEMSLRRVS